MRNIIQIELHEVILGADTRDEPQNIPRRLKGWISDKGIQNSNHMQPPRQCDFIALFEKFANRNPVLSK